MSQKVDCFFSSSMKTFDYRRRLAQASNRHRCHLSYRNTELQEKIKSDQRSKNLVLVGAGHAHLQVIRSLAGHCDFSITLIDAQTHASYSGMIPGCVSKLYSPQETTIDLKVLTNWAKVEFIPKRVTNLNIPIGGTNGRNKKELVLEDGAKVEFDAVSFDIGSSSRGLYETEGVLEHAIPTRPISSLVSRIAAEEEKLVSTSTDSEENKANVLVIGGGAAGIELAMAIYARWKPLFYTSNCNKNSLSVTLLHPGSELLINETKTCRAAIQNVLEKKNIGVMHRSKVRKISNDSIRLTDGTNVPYTHCIWATGASAHSLTNSLRKEGIAVSRDGWIRVNSTLQSLSHPYIFAAGDCATIENLVNEKTGELRDSPPKAGVYAVRAGPILIENLTRFFNSPSPTFIKYKPQDDFLKLLSCGDGTALGFRFGIPIQGPWVWQLKNTIDQLFMDLFKKENLPDLRLNKMPKGEYDTSQYDDALEILPSLTPEDAATLLMRTDANVDFQLAWGLIRKMNYDLDFRNKVLSFFGS